MFAWAELSGMRTLSELSMFSELVRLVYMLWIARAMKKEMDKDIHISRAPRAKHKTLPPSRFAPAAVGFHLKGPTTFLILFWISILSPNQFISWKESRVKVRTKVLCRFKWLNLKFSNSLQMCIFLNLNIWFPVKRFMFGCGEFSPSLHFSNGRQM